EMQDKAASEEKAKKAEREKILAERRKKAEEQREKRLEAERIELISLKQGVIEESETIHEESEEVPELTFWKKIGNFFYHNKWWLGMGIFLAAVAVYLVYGIATRERPDIIILVIGENYSLGEESELAGYIESFAEDFNGNGEVLASIYYMPYTGNQQKDYAMGVPTKLTAEIQSGDAVIVFGNQTAYDNIFDTDGILTDLSAVYPENPHIDKDRFMLKGTDFAIKTGMDESELTDDWFIAIREPADLMYDKKKNMQETYDKDFAVFNAIINDLSE
ncbi:MAG: hypothetical protein K2J37_06915, partial [Ruminococcus sp.]|nr:hypothetical protein [Ruminococcus sp.]